MSDCDKCGGTGLLNVPKKEIEAVITFNGRNDWQKTLSYVPPEVYGITPCPFCAGTHRNPPRPKRSVSMQLPDVGTIEIK